MEPRAKLGICNGFKPKDGAYKDKGNYCRYWGAMESVPYFNSPRGYTHSAWCYVDEKQKGATASKEYKGKYWATCWPHFRDTFGQGHDDLKVIGLFPFTAYSRSRHILKSLNAAHWMQVIGRPSGIARFPIVKVGYVDPRTAKKVGSNRRDYPGLHCEIDLNLQFLTCAGCCCKSVSGELCECKMFLSRMLPHACCMHCR